MGYYSLLDIDYMITTDPKKIKIFNNITEIAEKIEFRAEEKEINSMEKLEKVMRDVEKDTDKIKNLLDFIAFYQKHHEEEKFSIYIEKLNYLGDYYIGKDGYLDTKSEDWYIKHYEEDMLAYLIAYVIDPFRVRIIYKGEDGEAWGFGIENTGTETIISKIVEEFYPISEKVVRKTV